MSTDRRDDEPFVPTSLTDEEETGYQKFLRRMKEEPMIPLGASHVLT